MISDILRPARIRGDPPPSLWSLQLQWDRNGAIQVIDTASQCHSVFTYNAKHYLAIFHPASIHLSEKRIFHLTSHWDHKLVQVTYLWEWTTKEFASSLSEPLEACSGSYFKIGSGMEEEYSDLFCCPIQTEIN